MSVDGSTGVTVYSKCEGWSLPFSDVPHCSEWIQTKISDSMNKIFSIQGVTIDPDDWEYKLGEIFSSLYAFQDEFNASGWLSVFSIIPWKSMAFVVAPFFYSFFPPYIGLCYAQCFPCMRLTKAKRDIAWNVALFSNGLCMALFGILFAIVAGQASRSAALCSDMQRCEVNVMAGNLWAVWNFYGQNCTCEADWSSDFTGDCAGCVCKTLRSKSSGGLCNSIVEPYIVCMLFCLVTGFLTAGAAISRLSKQATSYSDELEGEKKQLEIKPTV